MQTLKDKVQGQSRVRNHRGGFTLIEVLVVIAIITILAGLLAPALRVARKKAMEAKARSMIASLQMAVSMYHTDYGVYPQSGRAFHPTIVPQYNGNSGGFFAPVNLVARLEALTGGGPYMEFKEDDIKEDTSTPPKRILVDPWGKAYIYVSRKAWYARDSLWLNVYGSGIGIGGPFHPHTDPDTAPHPNVDDNTYNIYSLGVDGKTYKGVTHSAPFWNNRDLYNDKYDGDTAYGIDDPIVDPSGDRKWLLDDINSWK